MIDATLSEESLEALAAELRGDVIAPGDPGYDESREIFTRCTTGGRL